MHSQIKQYQCQNCFLKFDKQSALQNHKKKFCINSKYNTLDNLQQQFNLKSKGRDISLYGKFSLNSQTYDYQANQLLHNSNNKNLNNSMLVDQQYQSILNQLTNKEDLKKKLQRQKNQAYQQLQFLQKRENDLLIDTRQQELQKILKRREQLQNEQTRIQQQMKTYQMKKKEMDQQLVKTDEEDYIYKQARYAGKLAKQRQLLEQKRREMQYQLKQKKRQKDEIEFKLKQSRMSEKNVFIPPDFKKNQQEQNYQRKLRASNPVIKTPEDSLDSLSFQDTHRQNKTNINQSPNHPQNYPQNYPLNNVSAFHQSPSAQNVGIQYAPHYSTQNFHKTNNPLSNNLNQPFPTSQDKYNFQHQKYNDPLIRQSRAQSNQQQEENYPYLNPKTFSKNQKLLTDMLNRNGKSEQDLFIEQLNAQQFDSLNLLSKIPKTSQLYEIKRKQFQQLSRLRDDYKKQAHQKRIDKMRREFDYEKKMMQKQMSNALWVDQNRKMMLGQQMNIIKNQQIYNKQQYSPQKQNMGSPMHGHSDINDPQIPSIENFHQSQSFPSNTVRQPNTNINPQLNQTNMSPITHQQQTGYNPSINRLDDNLWGYKIVIQSVKNYNRAKPLRIKVIVKQHDVSLPNIQNDDRVLKYQFTTTYHYEKIPPENSSFNLNMNNKFDNNQRNVNFKQQFIIPVNLQSLYNQNQNEIYLFLFAQQKDQAKISNQPVTYSWYNMKLTHFGQIKQGKFTLSLYGDQSTYPLPSDMNKKKSKLTEQIAIEINEVVLQKQKSKPRLQKPQISQQKPHQTPEIVPINQNKTRSQISASSYSSMSSRKPKTQSLGQQELKSSTSLNKPQSAQDPVYLDNDFETEFLQLNNKQLKNIDISVAQLRTLPSYIGPIKIQLSFIDQNNAEVIGREEIMADMGEDLYNPIVKYTKMIRNQKLITPTTILFIRILAINTVDFEIYMLGFTIFYMFFDQNTQPCSNNDIKQYYISTGHFQLPVFWGSCEPHYAKIEDVIDKYPLIPCTSILIGCNLNDKKDALPIPAYREKVYNTLLFNVEDIQRKLFQEQQKREKLDADRILKGYIKYKGINSKYTPEQSKNYVFKTMSFTKDNTGSPFPMDYMAEYNKYFGLYFSIDKITIPKLAITEKYYYYMTLCLYPPAKFYQKKDSSDLTIVYDVKPEQSRADQLVFEKNQIIFDPKFDENCCIIIEFHRLKINDENKVVNDKVQTVAHLIIPLFKDVQGVRSANVMKDTCNTYGGAFDATKIGQIKADLPLYLSQLTKKIKPSEIQISFRLMNGFFAEQFKQQQSKPLKDKNNKYLRIYSRPIDFQDAKRNIKKWIQKKYSVSL